MTPSPTPVGTVTPTRIQKTYVPEEEIPEKAPKTGDDSFESLFIIAGIIGASFVAGSYADLVIEPTVLNSNNIVARRRKKK